MRIEAHLTFGGRCAEAFKSSEQTLGGSLGIQTHGESPDAADADRIFAALADGGTVPMPIAESFWATRFAMLVDRLGTPWMVNCDKRA